MQCNLSRFGQRGAILPGTLRNIPLLSKQVLLAGVNFTLKVFDWSIIKIIKNIESEQYEEIINPATYPLHNKSGIFMNFHVTHYYTK